MKIKSCMDAPSPAALCRSGPMCAASLSTPRGARAGKATATSGSSTACAKAMSLCAICTTRSSRGRLWGGTSQRPFMRAPKRGARSCGAACGISNRCRKSTHRCISAAWTPHPFVTAKLQTSTVPAALERHCACPEISLLEPKRCFVRAEPHGGFRH